MSNVQIDDEFFRSILRNCGAGGDSASKAHCDRQCSSPGESEPDESSDDSEGSSGSSGSSDRGDASSSDESVSRAKFPRGGMGSRKEAIRGDRAVATHASRVNLPEVVKKLGYYIDQLTQVQRALTIASGSGSSAACPKPEASGK